MDKKNLTFILLILLIISLALRELPYINILVAGRLWIFYGLLLFLLIFPWKIRYSPPLVLILLSGLLLLGAFLLTLGRFFTFAEMFGVVIYFLLWAAVIFKITDLWKFPG